MDFKEIIKNLVATEILLLSIGFLIIVFYIGLSMKVNEAILWLLIMLMIFIFGVDFGLRLAGVMK